MPEQGELTRGKLLETTFPALKKKENHRKFQKLIDALTRLARMVRACQLSVIRGISCPTLPGDAGPACRLAITGKRIGVVRPISGAWVDHFLGGVEYATPRQRHPYSVRTGKCVWQTFSMYGANEHLPTHNSIIIAKTA